jgi:hypothetical protein
VDFRELSQRPQRYSCQELRRAIEAGAVSRVRGRTKTRYGGGETDELISVAEKNDRIESHLVAWKIRFSAIILGD